MPKKKCLKITIMSALLFIVIVCGSIFLKSKGTALLNQTENTMGNTCGNIINKGLTADYNGYIYYSNISDKYKLYSMKKDGSDKKKISDDSCSYINVIGDWIFYRNDDDWGKIYRIKTDGTMRTCLNKDDSTFVTVVGDFIYYCNSSNGNQITRIKNDGSNRGIICNDSAEYINVYNGWIYYSNASQKYSLCKVTVNGRKKRTISKDRCLSLNIAGDWIYYRNGSKEGKLCKIKINGKSNIILDTTDANCINVCGDWIYYKSANEKYYDSGLYKIKTNGTCKKNICNGLSEGINISSNWIFYINNSDKNELYKVRTDGTMKQNNDGITIVRSIQELIDSLSSNIPYEIKYDKHKKAYEKAKGIVKELIKPGMKDIEKEFVLHNYVVTHAKYNVDNYKKKNVTLDDASAYGILVNGIGVCAGYAEAMQLLLNLSGVECKYIMGMANGPRGYELHAWNIVKIDGEYYHLDATWNESVPEMYIYQTLKYFNPSDDIIKSDHKWEKNYYEACTSDRFSYLRDMDFPVYQDDWIYYSSMSDGYRLYKMRIDGSSKEKLSNAYAKYILVESKNIYFSNYSNKGYLYKIDINGKDEKQLNNENCRKIDIENGILKYTNDMGTTKTMKIR